MIFGTVKTEHSQGCYLAHSMRLSKKRLGKGTFITASIQSELTDNGVESVLVAQLEDGDVHEDTAAQVIANPLKGQGVSLTAARTGRVNLQATVEGLCHFDAQTIVNANSVDEGITIATLPENCWVAQGRMVATIKIIPYAVEKAKVHQVVEMLMNRPISVMAAIPHTAELIQTRLSAVKESVLDKTSRVTSHRLVTRQVTLTHEQRCNHDTEELCERLATALTRQPHWILIVGASAISDRGDVIPKAIVAAGGSIDRFGIPVDPGNLALLAHIGNTTIVGLPGCARSPRYNGFDMLLDRLACNVAITQTWLNGLSVGGLLTEIADRPAPRIIAAGQQHIGALILAAGSSRRAGSINKLLVPLSDNTAMVTRVAQEVCRSKVSQVIAVTGHQHEHVESALEATAVQCVHNKAHHTGMASSVVIGVSQLLEQDAILVCLGDMPHVKAELIDQLIEAYRQTPGKSIFLPVADEQRGNPVLFSKVFFDSLLALTGDIGARRIVQQHPHEVFEVPVQTDSILKDYDTPAELASLEKW